MLHLPPNFTVHIFHHTALSSTTTTAISTGVMDSFMCSHFLKVGYTVTVFTRTQSKAQSLLSMGAHWVDSPKSVTAQSDVVFSIDRLPSDVRHIILDPNTSALSDLCPGSILVDMTSLGEHITWVAPRRSSSIN
ncbi:putative 3-hydroxyisobutyrate dehydrogenase-like 1 [Forsythia ovata]|uniref:3-hydroxyisobutyrate dehydrogenase-like 1 n=1 Tax=Forsythia ovata TaxID=205694 RepID=A0ABD1R7F1_9LAMI